MATKSSSVRAAIIAALALVIIATLGATASARPLGRAVIATTKAPAVTKQPLSKSVDEGQSAVFESTASGTPTPTVQWERSTDGGITFNPIAGATSTQLTIASAQISESGNQFRAVFKNEVGTATSKAATLTVHKAPVVTQQPQNVTAEEGQNAVFEAAAEGFPTPTVQWQLSINGGATWTIITGATSTTLTITSVKTSLNGHEYRAVFTNTGPGGVKTTATSEPATLTVQNKPAMTKQPASIARDAGESASFEATASGFPTPTVQWELSTDGGATFNPIAGATSSTLTIESTSISEDANQFRAVFTNAAGAVTSEAATLTVHAPPVLTQEPASAIVETGETAVFEASASGYPTPTVQWQLSTNAGSTWVALTGATSDQLTIENAQVAESGHEFRAVFTNAAGTAMSNAASLTVATTKYNAVAWGSNAFRQLGDGSANFLSDVPVSVSGLKFVTAVAAGGEHSLALLANGTVMAWGSDEVGQLGNGQNESISSVPIAVEGVSEAVAVAAGESHSLALLKNGRVMAWGNNESGQLGSGSGALESTVPVEVKGLSTVTAIAAGANHSLALLANGTVMAWGENESGQLGNGNTTLSRVPVAVKGGLSGVTGISAGGKFSLALLSNGTVEGWGSNESGQLANASVEEGVSKLPVPVGNLTGVVGVAAGATHGLALMGSGGVMAWGEDSFGELGNGTIKPKEETPVAVSGLSGVTAISAGGQDSLALLGSGSVMAWGTNQRGTLGDGATGSPSAVPVLVSSLRKVASISAGHAHMLAFGEPTPAVTGVSPNAGPTAGGTTVTISGGDLAGATKVTFGANEATSFTVESSTSITATAPAGSGTVDVVVTTPAGVSPTGPADRYTYQLPPTVTKLLPKSGPTTGGTSVVITGTGFTGASAVSFGALAATTYTVKSSTSITAVAPARAAGTVDVRVTNTAGQSAIATADRFKYTPVIESVTPNSGSVSGGTSVEVTGTGFAPGSTATTFKFGKAKATAVNCSSSTTCTMKAPAHEAGTVHVVATVAKVLSPTTANDQFTYS